MNDNMRNYVVRTCRNCKKSFDIPLWETKKGKGSFCERACFKQFVGETSIEKIMRIHLTRIREPFTQEFRIGKFSADFYLPCRGIVVECDGEYWHRSELAKERDKRKNRFLMNLGLKIIRIDERAIKLHDWESLDYEIKSSPTI